MNHQKIWIVGLCAVATVLVTTGSGCTEECVDRFDCRSKGVGFICVDSKCVEGPPEADAGQSDAGEVDAGEDAGQLDGGVTDAGEDAGIDGGADAGPVDAGPDCTGANATCAGPFRCLANPDGGTGTCDPLWIGVTTEVDAGIGGAVDQAVLVRFNSTSSNVTLGSVGNTRFPRFSGAGDSVAYVQSPVALGPIELRHHRLDGGTDTVLADSDDAGTLDFQQLEYAPSNDVLWTTVGAMDTKDGIQVVSGSGGAVQNVLASGGYGDWFPNGSEFAFSGNGLSVHSLADGGTRIAQMVQAVEPAVSPDGKWIAYLVEDTSVTATYATSLSVVSASGGTANVVEPSVPAVGTNADGGTVGSSALNASWAGNARLVYVRESYFVDDAGVASLCTPQDPICAGKSGQVIVFRSLDANGAPTGAETVFGVGVQPAVSPDGNWLAYVVAGATGGQELHVVPIDANGVQTDAGFVHSFSGLMTGGKDARPRWQPK